MAFYTIGFIMATFMLTIVLLAKHEEKRQEREKAQKQQ
jgi:hypothetical protein